MRFLFSLICSLLLAQTALAVTHTVATKTAFTTAITNASAGDTIYISPGTYTNWGQVIVMHTKDATAGNRITITTDATNPATFQGNGALFLELRSAYWTVSNLKFRNQTTFGSFASTGSDVASLITVDGGQNIIIDNIRFENLSGPGVVMPVMRQDGVREIKNIVFSNISVDGYAQNFGAAAFLYVYGDTVRGLNTGVTVKDSVFSNRVVTSLNRDNYWIRLGSSVDVARDGNMVLQRLRFENDAVAVPGQDAVYIENSGVKVKDSTFFKAAGVESRRGNNNIFVRNTATDPNSTYSDYWLKVHGTGHTIANNLCYTALGSSTCLNLGMGNTDVNADGRLDYTAFSNSLVSHNTIDGFSSAAVKMNESSSGSSDGSTTVHPSNVTFVNNSIRQTAGTMVTATDCPSRFLTIQNNNWSGAANPGCLADGTNNTVADPRWVDPPSGDYGPSGDSPLINAGTTLSCVLETEIDHDGYIRDTSPDIGAFGANLTEDVIPPTSTCADTFGSANTYNECSSDDLTCTFSVFLNGASCGDLCQSYGKTCVTSYGNANNSCVVLEEDLCTVARTDQICVCKRNDEAPTPTAGGNFYVDSSCPTPGNGTTETCGATGPWNSLAYALDVADCAGMEPGDVLHVKGNDDPQSDGSWYAAEYDQPDSVGPDSSCSGIVVQNATGHYVTLDGTMDLSGQTWTASGSAEVFFCSSALCGTLANYPFTAWYKLPGGVEQRLNLEQTNTFCNSTLTAGTMRYDPVSKRVCARLSDGSSPADADYFRIPYYAKALGFDTEDADNITIRRNPDLTGDFDITRYRDDHITLNPAVSQGVIIDGLNLSWAKNRGIGMSGSTPTVANYKFLNNEISFAGETGIEWSYDLGTGTVEGNIIHDIGDYPVFQLCTGVGQGCLESAGYYATGIRVHNCATDDDARRGSIERNSISAMGGGAFGYAVGIELWQCSYGNLVNANLMYDSSVQGHGAHGIVISGIPAGLYHDENILSNNRFSNIDYGFTFDTDTATSQAGKVNYFVGNTCYNPHEGCYQQGDGAAIGGSLFVQNNIAAIDNGYVKLVNVPSSAHWNAGFENNNFLCSHADCEDQDIVTFQGVGYERFENCTPLVDCVNDLGDGNLYGDPLLACETMELSEGSIAINQGQNLAQLPLDYLGTSRPKDAFMDIGAHESLIESVFANMGQFSYRVYNTFLDDGEGPVSAENVSPQMHKRARFTLRLAIGGLDTETAQYIAYLVPYYQHCTPDCGNWTAISTNCTGKAACLVDHPGRETDSSIANDLSLDGRTFSANSRFIDLSSNSVPVVVRSSDQVELEFSLGLGDLVDTGDTINFRMQYSNGETISLYENTPSIEIVPAKVRKEVN